MRIGSYKGTRNFSRRRFCIGAAASVWSLSDAVARSPFPRSLPHKFGVAAIESAPKRIVTLGWNAEDITLALGVVPIGMERRALFSSGILPWNEQLLPRLKPTILTPELLDYEEIAELEPDLIIVLSEYSDFSDVAFRRLTRIAKTVVHQSSSPDDQWREQTSFVGRALGRDAAAQRLIEATEVYLDGVRTQFPKIEGKTFVYGAYTPGQSSLGVYLPSDARVAILKRIGLRSAPSVERLQRLSPGKWHSSMSLELLDRLDCDVFILVDYGGTAQQTVLSSPLFTQNRAIASGSFVVLDDPALIWASSALSVLSIPFGFQRVVPRLAEAATMDGKNELK